MIVVGILIKIIGIVIAWNIYQYLSNSKSAGYPEWEEKDKEDVQDV